MSIKEFREIEPNSSDKIIVDLLYYIESRLPEFINSPEFSNVLAHKKNENQHSLSFCLYMTNGCKSIFCFQRENSQLGSSTIDIGIYFGSSLIFTIEAKILPTPKTKSRCVHEYVYAEKCGGVQRFKQGNHGVDNRNNYFLESGMIAYIKENDFDYWLNTVNQWISQVGWHDSEKLEKVYFKSIARLISKHSRQTKQPDTPDITLHHFWVYVGAHLKTPPRPRNNAGFQARN